MITVGPRSLVSGRLRGRLFWAVIVLVLVGASGCSASSPPPIESPSSSLSSALTSMRSDNGLLFPPDLWTAVASDAQATAWYSVMARRTGTTYSQPVSDATLFRRLTSEVGAEQAAWVASRTSTHAASLLKPSCADFPAWQLKALRSGDARGAWQVRATSRAAGCPTAIDASTRHLLQSWSISPDVMRAWFAIDMLATADGRTKLPERHTLTNAADAATYLRLRVEQGASADSDNLLYQQARDEAQRDDQALYDLVSMQLAADRHDAARQLVTSLASRVQADGWISAPPDFTGTLGSTVKMVDWIKASGFIPLTDHEKKSLLLAVDRSEKDSTLAQIAAATLRQQLGGATVTPQTKSSLLTTLAKQSHLGAGPLTSVRASVAWAELAGYAQLLGTPQAFPGMNEQAVQEWRKSPLDNAAPVMARVVIRAAQAGGGNDPSVQQLAALLAHSQRSDSMTVIPVNLAIHLTQNRWVLPPNQLRALINRRRGDCLGGSDLFLRDTCLLYTSPSPRD